MKGNGEIFGLNTEKKGLHSTLLVLVISLKIGFLRLCFDSVEVFLNHLLQQNQNRRSHIFVGFKSQFPNHVMCFYRK
jgi:hypothetical protein